jgi:NADPH:quinone reductase-like Zn-dependent oxidoreductase
MRAVRLHAYANPPRIDDVASAPRPETGQMAIDVAAVGIGAWDAGVMTGRLERFVAADLPVVMGAELVGRVVDVGGGVDDFEVGDRVVCNPGIVGAWAERVTVPAERCGLAPESVDDAHAAALPVGALTAKQALDALELESGC